MALMKPCIECQINYSHNTRCDECQRRQDARRGSTASRGYGSAWQRMARAHLKRHRSCLQCGSVEDLTVDHIVPLSRGGKSTPHNLQTLCRSCNAAKRDR